MVVGVVVVVCVYAQVVSGWGGQVGVHQACRFWCYGRRKQVCVGRSFSARSRRVAQRSSCTPPNHPTGMPPPAPSILQLLRGLATGMKVSNFSSANQWRPYAEEAAKQLKGVPLPACLSTHIYQLC